MTPLEMESRVVRYGDLKPCRTAFIDAHTFDLYDEPMASLRDFDAYADKTRAALFEAALLYRLAGSRTAALAGSPLEAVTGPLPCMNESRACGHS